MRTSILSRSVVAVASLAIGSVALVASPATAATPSGITRDTVLTAANGSRIPDEQPYSQATETALRAMAVAQCQPTPSEFYAGAAGTPTNTPGNADGLLVFAGFYTGELDDNSVPIIRYCEFGAVASVDPSYSLSGTSSIVGNIDGEPVSLTAAISGDVAATEPIGGVDTYSLDTTFTAGGVATKTVNVQVDQKVADKKTKAQKKAAKKTYTKRVEAANKSYEKALKKAGKSKTRKAAAKRSFTAKKAAAKAAYKRATSPFKIVKIVEPRVDNRPFNVVVVDNTSGS